VYVVCAGFYCPLSRTGVFELIDFKEAFGTSFSTAPYLYTNFWIFELEMLLSLGAEKTIFEKEASLWLDSLLSSKKMGFCVSF
jgi:hypothetical protein